MEDFSRQAERLERAALADLHLAAPKALRRRLGLSVHTVDGTLASVAAGDPGIVVNRAIGLGVDAPGSRAAIEAVRDLYQAVGVRRFFFHLHPEAEPAGLDALMGDAGLVPARGWMKFRRGSAPAPTVRSSLSVREIGAEHAADFGRIAAAGFDLSAAGADWLAAMVNAPKWRLFMSFDGDTPAGTGALYIDGDLAWLDWGATDPAFRRRGGQSALLAARIQAALDAGCTAMATATGEAVPGDPQHSYSNILKAGFEESYLRRNFAPATGR